MIEQDAQALITAAITKETSDIHILPLKETYALYFRMNGHMVLHQYQDFDWGKRCISYFKYLANLDVGEKRKPQSGTVHYQVDGEAVELRLSTITNVNLMESLVIRVLRQRKKANGQIFGFFPKDAILLQSLVRRKSGLILFSGPVGSGKTTTIYQLLRDRLKNEQIQVITMEDPVEIIEEQFLQTEVNVKAGVTYDVLIKASLRHHPDILLIGEIRDEETARMVIRGALTGHLMIATIHAKNALGVIGRLQELSITDQQISQTLIGVVSQRLVPLADSLSHLNQGRAAILEILQGKDLDLALKAKKTGMVTLNHKLRKAWACGYITERSYHHFEIV